MIRICVWPDDMYCDQEDIEYMSWKSDDYIVVEVTPEEYEEGNFNYSSLLLRRFK